MLYAAHVGWLSSTIKYKNGKSEETTSKAEYYSGGLVCRTPELDGCAYLGIAWDELGKCQSSGMSISPTNWSEITHYAETAGIAKWEGHLLHSMSKIFVDARSMFSDLVCEPPYLYGGFSFQRLSADAADRRRKK